MKFLAICAITTAVSGQTLSALEQASQDEMYDAIASIESELANSGINDLELTAYNSC